MNRIEQAVNESLAPTKSLEQEIDEMAGWVGNELGRGRLTGVQVDFLNRKVRALYTAIGAGVR